MTSEFVIDFPTLGDLGEAWIRRHCRVPDGFTRGRVFEMSDWQFWCHANRYRIRADAVYVPRELVGPDNPPTLNQAFVYQQTLVVAPQKTGKGPYSASQVAFEAAGPSVFGGWAVGGEVYSCAENGCPCGWEDTEDAYVFQPGEPMGIRHPSPLIQITANSAEQADNIYKPLRGMINLGPLKELLAVREGFIRILGLSNEDDLDRIDVVTSSARSRLGNPISDAEQDEAGLYTKSNKMVDVADTQARGAAGMGGRTHLTTNAWDPSENSYAQMVYEAQEPDTFIFYRDPDKYLRGADGKPLRYAVEAERRKIHEYAYEGSWWVNLDSIEALARKLMKRDPAQAERFFGNRLVRGAGRWLTDGLWDGRLISSTRLVQPKTPIVLGFDGSDNDDHTGIRAETIPDLHQFTPTYGEDDRPTLWDPAEHGGRVPRDEVMVAFRDLAQTFTVVRAYLDPFLWESEADTLAGEFGDTVFVKWATNRIAPMHAALDRLKVDLQNPDSPFTHDDDEAVRTHMGNATMRTRVMDPLTGIRRYIIGKPAGEDHRKIDYAMSSTLAHEAAMDVLASGWKPRGSTRVRVWH